MHLRNSQKAMEKSIQTSVKSHLKKVSLNGRCMKLLNATIFVMKQFVELNVDLLSFVFAYTTVASISLL